MLTHSGFLSKIEAFLETADISAFQFGWDALGDPRFVYDVRKGRVPKPSTQARVLRFIEKKSRKRAGNGR